MNCLLKTSAPPRFSPFDIRPPQGSLRTFHVSWILVSLLKSLLAFPPWYLFPLGIPPDAPHVPDLRVPDTHNVPDALPLGIRPRRDTSGPSTSPYSKIH